MPSTLVHVGIAALLACALLGPAFRGRTVLVVLAATAAVDLDTLLGVVVLGAHRAAFHTLLVPAALALALAVDVAVREESLLVDRFGGDAPRVGAVAIAGILGAAILPDMATNGVNALYPLHDQFYVVDGKAIYSTERGFVQTLFESAEAGSTDETQFRTGVDPEPDQGGVDRDAEREFWFVASGTQLLWIVLGAAVTTVRLWETGRTGERPGTDVETDPGADPASDGADGGETDRAEGEDSAHDGGESDEPADDGAESDGSADDRDGDGADPPHAAEPVDGGEDRSAGRPPSAPTEDTSPDETGAQ